MLQWTFLHSIFNAYDIVWKRVTQYFEHMQDQTQYDIAERDVYCSTVMSLQLIYMFWQLIIFLKLTGIYDIPFESGRTLTILEVWGRLWCLFSAYERIFGRKYAQNVH